MATQINIKERMKVFEGLDGMSEKSIKEALYLIQTARENRQKFKIEEELRQTEAYLENYTRKSEIFDTDKIEYARKEARYRELEAMLKNRSDKKTDPSLSDELEKLKGLSDEEFDERELQLRVYCKVRPYLESAMRTIESMNNEYETQRKFLNASKQRARKTNNQIRELDKQIAMKLSELNSAKNDDEKEKISTEYEALLEKRSEFKFKNVNSVDKDLAKIREEHNASPELTKAYRTIKILTDRNNFQAIDKMSEEQIRAKVENVFDDKDQKIKLDPEKREEESKPEQSKPEQSKPEQGKPGQGKPEQDEPEQDGPEQDEPGEDLPTTVKFADKHPKLAKITFVAKFMDGLAEKKLERQLREDNFVKGFSEEYGNEPSKFKRFLARHPRIREIAKSLSKYKEAYDEIKMFSEKDYSENETPDNAEPKAETGERDSEENAFQDRYQEFAKRIHVDVREQDSKVPSRAGIDQQVDESEIIIANLKDKDKMDKLVGEISENTSGKASATDQNAQEDERQ